MDLLAQLDELAVEGGKVLASKKRGRPRKVTALKEPGKKERILLGNIQKESVVFMYQKRICDQCKTEELSAFPRVFLQSNYTKQPATKQYKRVMRRDEAQMLLSFLPHKVELWPTHQPVCKHCLEELINAKPSERHSTPVCESPEGVDPSDVPPIPGDFQTASGTLGVSARWLSPIHNSAY